jgi:hypothetical protein
MTSQAEQYAKRDLHSGKSKKFFGRREGGILFNNKEMKLGRKNTNSVK